MPNRIIKESLCYSEDIDQLSSFEETVFIRLIINVDDCGRIDARPSFLKSKLFVTKQGVTEKNIKDALLKLASVGLVKFYEVDGKSFLKISDWEVLQPDAGRRTNEYKQWRTSVFQRDRYTCQICGKVGGKLNAHHKKRYSKNPSLRTDANNGITLCESCHKKIHKAEGK